MNDEHIHESSAVVLDCRPYRETSQILSLLSRQYGRVEAVARGSRKPRGGIPDRFCQIYGVWRKPKDPNALVTLTRWEIEREFPAFRVSLLAYGLASFWTETVKALVKEGQESESTFEQTVQFLAAVSPNVKANRLPWGFLQMFWRLLEIHGFVGPWQSCAFCGSTEGLSFFSFSEMGPVCARCAGKACKNIYPLSELLVRKLGEDISKERSILVVPARVAAEFFALYDSVIAHICGRRLSSLPVLLDLLDLPPPGMPTS